MISNISQWITTKYIFANDTILIPSSEDEFARVTSVRLIHRLEIHMRKVKLTTINRGIQIQYNSHETYSSRTSFYE